MSEKIITLFTFNTIKVFLMAVLAAVIAFLLAPLLIKFLNKTKFWKKEARQKTINGEEAKIVYSLHKEREINRPRGGGILIWLTILILIFLFFILSFIKDPWWLKKLNFLSRAETWLPLFTLVITSLIGLFDDILVVNKDIINKFRIFKGYIGGGLTFKTRLFIVGIVGLIGGWWFWEKLGWSSIHIPIFYNFPYGFDLNLGFLIIPLFIIVMIASWSGGVIDGLDGLAGGVFASIFGAFTIISFSQGKNDLAAFCAAIFGTLFAFLWFNIKPARFYMGETGVLGLTSTMTVISFLTDSVAVLPIIAAPLVIESGSVILQLISKKFRNKKIWLATPIHHHFEAKGLPDYQIVMRFWIISVVFAIFGTIIRLLG